MIRMVCNDRYLSLIEGQLGYVLLNHHGRLNILNIFDYRVKYDTYG